MEQQPGLNYVLNMTGNALELATKQLGEQRQKIESLETLGRALNQDREALAQRNQVLEGENLVAQERIVALEADLEKARGPKVTAIKTARSRK